MKMLLEKTYEVSLLSVVVLIGLGKKLLMTLVMSRPRTVDGLWIFWIILHVLVDISDASEYMEYPAKVPISDSKSEAILFLNEYDREASEMCNRVANAKWKYITNATDFNRRRMREQQSVAAKFDCISWRRAQAINSTGQIDSNLRRQFDRILKRGHCGLGELKFLELNHVLTLMKDKYNNAKICPFTENRLNSLSQTSQKHKTFTEISDHGNYVQATTTYCDLKLEPDIIRVMQLSRSEPELRHTWIAWRDVTGPSIRNTFMRYVDLANQAACIHGFRDAGDQMRSAYEDSNLYFTVQDLWSEVQPLYKQLFSYVRKGLVQYYRKETIRKDGPIPGHLLGDVWAENFENIFEIIYPGPLELSDITKEMIKQGYTPLRIFQTAEEFYSSMGLPPMVPEFWRNSVLQQTNEVFTQCKTTAWDFCNKVDFRIKQCTQVTLEDYINAHRQMADIQYAMHYSSQPYVFRDGPNPAFKEAVAGAIGLCVSGPAHLQKVGLFPKSIETESGNSRTDIEFLLKMALEKLPLMAFSLALEKWRWHVFEKGPIGMNARWWELQLRYMGVTPPVSRSNEHFDPGAKYHVISDQDYLKHFIATVLEFQIFAEMCQASNHIGPLHTCDFYRSRDAGRILIDIMQNGASLSTEQLIKLFTKGKTNKISVEPLLEYFRPLDAWLEIQNRDDVIGWNLNMDDVALYQPLQSSSFKILLSHEMCGIFLFVIVFLLC